MGNVAACELSECIRAWMVGFHSEVASIVRRSNEWLDRAIKEDEKFGVNPDLHRVTLYQARALGEWMETGSNEELMWNRAHVHEESAWRYVPSPWSNKEILQNGLDDFMAFACQSGKQSDTIEAAIATYERRTGRNEISLKKSLKPRDFGYARCLHLARRQFDPGDLFEAGRKMLQAHLEEKWLGGGQFIRAATWLMIVYCDDSSLSPLRKILCAYDNMPSVHRPDWLA
ncbi:hypothetical protein GmRootV59_61080 (plasmid) [Variovorax sp. V59]